MTSSEQRETSNEKLIHLGTSGYSFKDWVGNFYPQGTKPDQMLTEYSRHFDVVEINTTYYGIPKPGVFEKMASQVPPEFGFYIKVHQDVTHKRENPAPSARDLFQAVDPLKNRGMLRGYLAQFPYSFKKILPSRDYLARLADLWADREPLFVEFRHTGWYKPDVFDFLKRSNLGFVNVDLPPLPKLPGPSAEVTNGIGYFRFHGRNAATWWGQEGPLRYDYMYTEAELRDWAPRIKDVTGKAKQTIIFMNNCHLGQAARNARMLKDMFIG
jgi:uncharacterized protein YecE (DUF72 family)